MSRCAWRSATALAVVALSGCALRGPAPGDLAQAPAELAATPFFEQRVDHCGPAALATLLVDSGRTELTPDALSPVLFVPERAGTLRTELLAVSRAQGRVPLTINGSMDGLLAALDSGYPVLVLQNLGVRWIPRWHYAVVVGVDAERGTVVLRSGREPRRHAPIDIFLRTWARSDYWGMVVSAPDAAPPFAQPLQWLRAAAPAESAGQTGLALAAFTTAVTRWPESALAHAALGNAHYAMGDTAQARRYWQDALRLNPDLQTARDNLAATAPD